MIGKFPDSLDAYAAARDDLLERIAAGLADDPRFVAVWLGGSLGRGNQDAVSDIDLFAVVIEAAAVVLCQRPAEISAGSVPARLEVFTRFGEPVNIHENHSNAPSGGTFSSVLYLQPPVIVDWVLIPWNQARRPPGTRLLFERIPVPQVLPAAETSLSIEERALKISERAAFFWMMAMVTAKYIVRGRTRMVQDLLARVENIAGEIERLVDRDYEPAGEALYLSKAGQAERLLLLCERVEGAGAPAEPRTQVEAVLKLAKQRTG